GGLWRRLLGSSFNPNPAIDAFSDAVWQLIRGASRDADPSREAGRRYADVLAENLAQPGFRELMIVATDLDSRADVVAAMLREPRLGLRRRLGEFISAAEAAALRDAMDHALLRFDSFYVICPSHNPVGPFDFAGAYDEASDRRHSTLELMERGYEDAYHQFIEPVVGASGEMIAHGSGHGDRSRGLPETN